MLLNQLIFKTNSAKPYLGILKRALEYLKSETKKVLYIVLHNYLTGVKSIDLVNHSIVYIVAGMDVYDRIANPAVFKFN